MGLIYTIGDSESNSYVSADEANEYFVDRPFSETWEDTFNQDQILINATRLIDWNFNFNGQKTTTTQALQWPRKYSYDSKNNIEIEDNIIPIKIKHAVYELSIMSLTEDRVLENDMIGLSKIKVGSLEIQTDNDYKSQSKKNSIPDIVYKILNGLTTANSGVFKRVVRF